MDDGEVAYSLESQRAFEDLRQVLGQLAGLMVLAAAGGKSAMPDHPMLEAATELHRETVDRLRAMRPTKRAQAHHDHLLAAARGLDRTLTAARQHLRRLDGAIELDPIMVPLRMAEAELSAAGRILPGFDMVDFAQGCCALHAAGNT